MTKQELINSLAKEFDFSKSKSDDVIKHVFNSVKTSLTKGEPFTLIGFGTFSVKKRAARNGRNPSTGEAIKIPAHKVIRFAAGKNLKESVNKK